MGMAFGVGLCVYALHVLLNGISAQVPFCDVA